VFRTARAHCTSAATGGCRHWQSCCRLFGYDVWGQSPTKSPSPLGKPELACHAQQLVVLKRQIIRILPMLVGCTKFQTTILEWEINHHFIPSCATRRMMCNILPTPNDPSEQSKSSDTDPGPTLQSSLRHLQLARSATQRISYSWELLDFLHQWPSRMRAGPTLQSSLRHLRLSRSATQRISYSWELLDFLHQWPSRMRL
jgi:hypothetical protein